MASAFAIFAFQRTGPTLPPHKWIVVFSLSICFGSLYFSRISSGILTSNMKMENDELSMPHTVCDKLYVT